MEQMGNLIRLRTMMQMAPLQQQAMQQQVQSQGLDIQAKQREMASAQALMDSFKGANPSDPESYAKSIQKAADTGQVLPQQLMGAQNLWLDMRNKASTYTETQQKIQQNIGDSLHSLGNEYLKESDAQMLKDWPQVRQKIIEVASADPNFNPASVPQQFPTRQGVETYTHLYGMSAAAVRAAAAQQTAKYKVVGGALYDVSGGEPKPALAGQMSPQQWSAAIDQVIPNTPANTALRGRTQSLVNFYLGQGNVSGAQKAISDASQQIGAIEKQTNPEVVRTREEESAAEGASRAGAYANLREYPVYDNQSKSTVYLNPSQINAARTNEPGRYTVPSYTAGALGEKAATNYFVSGKGGQQLTAFNTALNHLDTLDSLATDLSNSNIQVFNKAAQAWAQQTGNPAPTNFAAAKNAMSGEVAAALKASGATDEEIRKVDETFSRVQSPAQLHGAIDTYRTLLKSKAHNLENQYNQGMQGRPNFGQENGAPESGGDPFAQFGGKAH